jgi:hypothetical protein
MLNPSYGFKLCSLKCGHTSLLHRCSSSGTPRSPADTQVTVVKNFNLVFLLDLHGIFTYTWELIEFYFIFYFSRTLYTGKPY